MNTQLHKNDPSLAKEYFSRKMEFTTGPVELNREIENRIPLVVVDVRAKDDFEKGHIPGAINLPKEEWNAPQGLSRDMINVLYCYSSVCHLAATAAVEFAGKGYSVMEMDGGFEAWKENDLEIEK
jgi:rhodanese-related sulfurtransferase